MGRFTLTFVDIRSCEWLQPSAQTGFTNVELLAATIMSLSLCAAFLHFHFSSTVSGALISLVFRKVGHAPWLDESKAASGHEIGYCRGPGDAFPLTLDTPRDTDNKYGLPIFMF